MTAVQARENRIEKWMTTIVQDGGIERHDDLHVDEIDSHWSSRENWVGAGLEAYGIAVRMRDFHKLGLAVVLAFSLKSGHMRRGINFRTVSELATELDWSPPSLYIFRPDGIPCAQEGDDNVIRINLDATTLLGVREAMSCCYLEFKSPGSAEYARSVLLAG